MTPAQRFATMAVRSAIRLYLKTGLKANRDYTPKNMLTFTTRLTGRRYPISRTGLILAKEDLDTILETAQ